MGVARPFSHPVWPSGFIAAAVHWAIGSGHPGWRHLLAQMRVSWASRIECGVRSEGCWLLSSSACVNSSSAAGRPAPSSERRDAREAEACRLRAAGCGLRG
jgi:hypothetical protein